MPLKTLRLILGDQLNIHHSWFQNTSDKELNEDYLIMELGQELNYVRHHIQKIAGFFLAMRNFNRELEALGKRVIYYELDATFNTQSLTKNILGLINQGKYDLFEYQLPDECRLDNELKNLAILLESEYSVPTKAYDTEHFYSVRGDLKVRFGERKSYLMESFYRQMRKEYKILMNGNSPIGETWNFDSDNRKPYTSKTSIPFIKPFAHDISAIITLLDKMGISYLGEAKDNLLPWPISRVEALEVLTFFTDKLLPHFGTFEDAMQLNEKFLFHSRLSFVLNIKLISPKEVIYAAIQAFEAPNSLVTISQIEGFVRQILGWREFMRQIYWTFMPNYTKLNYFNHQEDLPNWYWTGKTKMQCLSSVIHQTLEDAYAHHIQRLMITGSFALLIGTHPDQVDSWYLGVYMDAIEWVQITNTRGMSQFADGGIIGTKPYVSGANYISKMSNYCSTCYYDPKKRYGVNACPFNSLYWNFFLERKLYLQLNTRVALVYRNLEKMNYEEIEKIQNQAKYYLSIKEKL